MSLFKDIEWLFNYKANVITMILFAFVEELIFLINMFLNIKRKKKKYVKLSSFV